MISKINRIMWFFLPFVGILAFGSVKSQTLPGDSLSLNTIISNVTTNHPLVKNAMEDLNVSDAKIGLAEANYLPNVDFTSSYTKCKSK
jgi:outer membrane protein TolC